jgi:hypothetical protein
MWPTAQSWKFFKLTLQQSFRPNGWSHHCVWILTQPRWCDQPPDHQNFFKRTLQQSLCPSVTYVVPVAVNCGYGTPDSGYRNYPKHVEWSCNKIKILVLRLVGHFVCIYRKWCTEPWTWTFSDNASGTVLKTEKKFYVSEHLSAWSVNYTLQDPALLNLSIQWSGTTSIDCSFWRWLDADEKVKNICIQHIGHWNCKG